jgi:hypothetical protein
MAPKLMATGDGSELVDKNPDEAFNPLVDAELIIKPVNVMDKVVKAAIVEFAVVMTISFETTDKKPMLAKLMDAFGTAAALKKPGGQVKVIELPTGNAPPTLVVKLRIAETFVLPGNRSEKLISNTVE